MTAPFASAALSGASPLPGRLGYVLGAFPVLSETFVSGEMRAMERLGVEAIPFVFDLRDTLPDPADGPLRDRALAVGALPDRLPRAVPAGGAWQALGLIRRLPARERPSAVRHALRIAAAARAAGCVWLHGHFAGGAALHALAAARLAGIGASFTVHSGAFARNFADERLIGPMVQAADLCVAVSAPLERALAAAGARRTARVPCGADLERFRPRAPGADNGRLLFVGRLVDCKGVDDLLLALARLDPGRRPGLDVAGDGPVGEALGRLARSLDLDVRFLGRRPNAWFAGAGGAYLGFAAPFRPGRDGQADSAPVVLKEAMALGLPIVTTALEGVVEAVGNAAILARPADPDSLARRIGDLLAMGPEGRDRLSARAVLRAERSGLDAQAAGLLAAIAGARA